MPDTRSLSSSLPALPDRLNDNDLPTTRSTSYRHSPHEGFSLPTTERLSSSAFCCRRRASVRRSKGTPAPASLPAASNYLKHDVDLFPSTADREGCRGTRLSNTTPRTNQTIQFSNDFIPSDLSSSEALGRTMQIDKSILDAKLVSPKFHKDFTSFPGFCSTSKKSDGLIPLTGASSSTRSSVCSIQCHMFSDVQTSPIHCSPPPAETSEALVYDENGTSHQPNGESSLHQYFTEQFEKLLRVSAVGVALGISIKMFFVGLQFWVTSAVAFILRLVVCQLLDNLIRLSNFSTLHKLRAGITDPWTFYRNAVLTTRDDEAPHDGMDRLNRHPTATVTSSLGDLGRMFPNLVREAFSFDGVEFNTPTISRNLDVFDVAVTPSACKGSITPQLVNEQSSASASYQRPTQKAELVSRCRFSRRGGTRWNLTDVSNVSYGEQVKDSSVDIPSTFWNPSYNGVNIQRAECPSDPSPPPSLNTSPSPRLIQRLLDSVMKAFIPIPVLRLKCILLGEWVGRQFSNGWMIDNSSGIPGIQMNDSINLTRDAENVSSIIPNTGDLNGNDNPIDFSLGCNGLYVRKTTDEIFGWTNAEHDIAHHNCDIQERSNPLIRRCCSICNWNLHQDDCGKSLSIDTPPLLDDAQHQLFEDVDTFYSDQSGEPNLVHSFNSKVLRGTITSPQCKNTKWGSIDINIPTSSISSVSRFFSQSNYSTRFQQSMSCSDHWNEVLFHLKRAIYALWNLFLCIFYHQNSSN